MNRIIYLIPLPGGPTGGLLLEVANFHVAGVSPHHHQNDHHEREADRMAERRKRPGK